MTQQSFKDECDINQIMDKYQQTGFIDEFYDRQTPNMVMCPALWIITLPKISFLLLKRLMMLSILLYGAAFAVLSTFLGLLMILLMGRI